MGVGIRRTPNTQYLDSPVIVGIVTALRSICIFLLLLALSTICLAESSVWVVKDKDKDEVVYLGGTIHVLRASDYPLPREFDLAFADAEQVLFETDIARLLDPETRQSMREKLRYHDGRTLSQVLSKAAYAALEMQARALGISLAQFEAFRPVAVLLGLLALQLERLDVSAEGVDEHFFARALAARKLLGSLESVESQFEVLAAMGEGQESAFVTHSIEELKQTGKMLDDAIAAWRVGDTECLEMSLLARTKRDYPGLYSSLIVERNREWLPKIMRLFSEPGREFVLVGVAHLVGEDGLLRRLERAGYQIRQLNREAVVGTAER